MYSNLVSRYVPASTNNYRKGRSGYNICKITPHHMGGILSADQCGSIFQNPSRKASSNYGIGNDGKIDCYVNEEDRSYCSSSAWNDNQAITIEISNNNTKYWTISDKAWNSLILLCVDICKRYNFRLEYTGDKNGSLTKHKMYAATDCPGPYLDSKMNELAYEVNRRLDGLYSVGQRVLFDIPVQVAIDGTPNKSLVDSNGYQFWIHSSVVKDSKNGKHVYGLGEVIKVYNDGLYRCKIFDDEFDCKPCYMSPNF